MESSRAALLGGGVVAGDGCLERCRFEVDFDVGLAGGGVVAGGYGKGSKGSELIDTVLLIQ